MKKRRKKDSLMFRFVIIFAVMAIVVLAIAGYATFRSQMTIYKHQCENDVKNVGFYLASLLENEGDDTVMYRDYFMTHYRDAEIPIDFDGYEDAYKTYMDIMAEKHPGKSLGVNISLSELSKEAQEAYFVYTHEYWTTTFETATKDFGLSSTYFLIMAENEEYAKEHGFDVDFENALHLEETPITGKRDTVVYLIDAGRYPREDNEHLLDMGVNAYNPREHNHELMWRTWDEGKAQSGYKEWDNDWGHTYGYFVPVIINGEKIGLVGTEIDVASVNREILNNTLIQLSIIAAIFIIGLIITIVAIHRNFILKTVKIEEVVSRYAETKNVAEADALSVGFESNDELSSLGRKVGEMIHELTEFMISLKQTTSELATAKEHASEMSELANKDSLTGIRNKTAYDNEVKKLSWDMGKGLVEFGFAVIDLNYLKRINDTFGHDKGNTAIKNCCNLTCRIFAHSPVFRIGGDEFVVILKGEDYEHIDQLVGKFNQKLQEIGEDASLEPWEQTSAAIGYALYDKQVDTSIENVFKRADRAMYNRKKEMKAIRID